MEKKTELQNLIDEIKENTTGQVAINKVDEVRVMTSMLNDPEFTLGVYDKNLGLIGSKCPHDEAVKFVKNVVAGATGLEGKEAKHLAENYEFTKRDANFMLDNMRSFIQVYTQTGRKINVMQTAETEACLLIRQVAPGVKTVPSKDNPDKMRQIETVGYTKLVSSSKCPRYLSGK